jgi:nucleoside-diphosphate-sugar epimerase
MRRVLITGAAGNLGGKLRRHLESSCELILLDRDPRGDAAIEAADLSRWGAWAGRFAGIDSVFHLAADPTAQIEWPDVVAPNMDAVCHVFGAAVVHQVRRVVFASSNHVMGGYQHLPEPRWLTHETPPLPGTRYVAGGEPRDSTPYASAKLFAERLGKCLAESHGIEFIAARLGWIKPGDNPASGIAPERGEWFRLMWLSNRDYCHLMERCLVADMPGRFLIVNGMSDNAGMRWDLTSARALGYAPRDDVSRG